jgi:hypothetical protein
MKIYVKLHFLRITAELVGREAVKPSALFIMKSIHMRITADF